MRNKIMVFKTYALLEPGDRRILLLEFPDLYAELVLFVFEFQICALGIIVLPEGQQ